jgi:dTDP-4-dehydrorhamnose reductase
MLMDKKAYKFIPEIWGGIECSYNRVGDHYMDQLSYCNHYSRGGSDLERFSELGIKSIRYPIIWERHQSALEKPIDWSWTEKQLDALRNQNIVPIAGLLHHGNGPTFTDLLDEKFPVLFADYARQVATKFPWIEHYTPINEPLTTARFSGLYGIWYPHKKRDVSFVRILVNQMKAIVLAMREIRKINPRAKLIQSEDLSKTYSTPRLEYQASFENERRWLTYDLLCGKVKPGHKLWTYFKGLRIPEEEFLFFCENPCPPDLIGADHYLTSERYLDQAIKNYPHYTHGGNKKHRYADVEAIRVNHPHPWGLKLLLKECWDRYQIPMAVTEVHLNGSSDDQIRWFREVYDVCLQLGNEGIEIKGVTAWAMLGSYGWNHLLTQPHGHYEIGAFDVIDGSIKATALAQFLKLLSGDADATHPCLKEKGWWQVPERCLYNVSSTCKDVEVLEDRAMPEEVALEEGDHFKH